MASSIGIKIANGEFYPVIVESLSVKKRLILTTVHDNQRSVQIDLYRSATKTMSDAAYIGSLVVEDIAPRKKGDPSIELVISSDGSDELTAEALDLDSSVGSERQHLSVSLKALDENNTYDVPDFEIEQESVPPKGLYERNIEQISNVSVKETSSPLPIVLAIVAGIALVLFLVWFFLFRQAPVKKAPPAPVKVEQPAPPPVIEAPAPVAPPAVTPAAPAEPVAAAEPAPVPAKRVRPPAPVESYKVPRVIPKDGVRYKIRWGDTLWDISEAFYRNPWLYPRIARFNSIRNPDLIISGHWLRVPPKKK